MLESIDRRRLLIPMTGVIYDKFAPFSYALVRFVTGAILFPHGVQKVLYGSIERYAATISGKGLPFGLALAYLTFFAESVGAVCLALGLFTRIAAAMIFVEMVVIVIYFLWPNGFSGLITVSSLRCYGRSFALPYFSEAAGAILSITISPRSFKRNPNL